MQFAPFAMLFLLSIASSLPFGGETTPYSLRRMEGHTLPRATEGLGVPYWVADSFELWYPDAASLRKVEDRVEADALQRARRRCQHERASKQRIHDTANRYQGDERSRMFEAADKVPMRWCEESDRLEAAKAVW